MIVWFQSQLFFVGAGDVGSFFLFFLLCIHLFSVREWGGGRRGGTDADGDGFLCLFKP